MKEQVQSCEMKLIEKANRFVTIGDIEGPSYGRVGSSKERRRPEQIKTET